MLTPITPGIPSTRSDRLAYASGILAGLMHLVFTALFVGFVLPQLPPVGAPPAEFATAIVQESASPVYTLVSFLLIVPMLVLVPFFGGLYTRLRRIEGEAGSVAITVLAAGLVFSLLTPIAEFVEHHLMFNLALAGVDPRIVQSTDGMTPTSFALGGLLQILILLGTTSLLRPQRLSPGWLTGLGLVTLVVSILGAGTLLLQPLFPFALLSALLFKVWVLGLGAVLLRESATQRGAARQAAMVA